MNTCRFCGVQEFEPNKLLQYGVRHHAHAPCLVRAKGLDALLSLHAWQLKHVPVFPTARAAGLSNREMFKRLDTTIKAKEAAEAQP